MTYKEAADKAAQAATAARQVKQTTDDPALQGLAEAIALLAESVRDMSATHHRQF
jgi:hypothetical protein